MQENKLIEIQEVPEWRDAYVNQILLTSIQVPFKYTIDSFVKTKFAQGKEQQILINVNPEELKQSLLYFNKLFESALNCEIDKINSFYQFKLMDLMRKWRFLKQNAQILQGMKLEFRYEQLKNETKGGFQTFYKEIKMLKEFLESNQIIIDHIIRTQNNVIKFIGLIKDEHMFLRLQNRQNNSFISRNFIKIDVLISNVEKEYLEQFFTNYRKNDGLEELQKVRREKVLSQRQTFYLGLFTGISVLFFIYITILFILGDLNPEETTKSSDSFQYIFPIFRGVGLFILYIWLLALNVQGWNKFSINYKLIFRFGHHFSLVSQIMKRAAVFTAIFFIMFLWYILQKMYPGFLEVTFWLPMHYTPLIVWVCLLGYLFFPSNQIFNPQGRRYFYDLMTQCIISPIIPMWFGISWATDQFVSFVGPLKDFEFTLCFYTSDLNNWNSYKDCSKSTSFSYGFLMAVIPLIFRMAQCARSGYDKGKFVNTPDFWNFFKYCASFFTAFFSYMYKWSSSMEIYWIISACVSTLYSYYWDLKMDWGFLETGSKFKLLRDQLLYHNPSIYYVIMVANFFLRLAWVLSISPDTAEQLHIAPAFFTLVISFLEMFRRCLWNFFRVEKEHIANCSNLQAVNEISLTLKPIRKVTHMDVDQGELLVEVQDEFKQFQDELNKNNNIQQQDSNPLVKKTNYDMSKKAIQEDASNQNYQESEGNKYPNQIIVDNSRKFFKNILETQKIKYGKELDQVLINQKIQEFKNAFPVNKQKYGRYKGLIYENNEYNPPNN